VQSNLPLVLQAVCNVIRKKYTIAALTKIHMDHSRTEGLDSCGTKVQAPVYLTTCTNVTEMSGGKTLKKA
jgi:hypothetical protein